MPKTALEQWDETAANNTDMGGIDLSENVMRPPAVNNEMREHMAQVAKWLGDDTLASASTTDLGSVPGRYVSITGTTTITAFGTIKAGTVKYVKFTGALTLTHNATSLILPGAANITTATGDTAVFVSEGSGNWRCLAYQKATGAAVSAALKGHIYGLTLSNNGSDATNDIDIAAGEAASTETSPVLMVLASALTKRLDAAWAVGTGNGGLDTGSIANGAYHVWLIRRSGTGVVDVLFSASATSPTMPTDYDQKRRIGSISRISTAIVAFTQKGDEFLLNVPVREINNSTLGTTAVTNTLSYVPTGIKVDALLNGYIRAASNAYVLLTSFDQTDTAASGTVFTAASIDGGYAAIQTAIRTNTSAQFRSRSSVASTEISLMTNGWIDRRDKDA